MILVIAANKCDLVGNNYQATEEGEELAKKYNARFFATSAKASIGVNELFGYLAAGNY